MPTPLKTNHEAPKVVFETLYAIDVSPYVQTRQQGGRSIQYLEWAVAWKLFKQVYPDGAFHISPNSEGLPYFKAENFGVFVQVSVWTDRATSSVNIEWYPVDVPRDGTITTFEISNAHQRALVKCLGRMGLGLKLWEAAEREEMPPSLTLTPTRAPGAHSPKEFRMGIPKNRNYGKTLEEMGDLEVMNDYNYWLARVKGDGKPATGAVKDFLTAADLYLKAKARMKGHKDFEEPPPYEDRDLSEIPF